MPSLEEIRKKARRDLHQAMGRPAFYYASLAADQDYSEITVRRKIKPGMVGDLAGTNLNYAEVHDFKESVIFWNEQVTPIRNALVVLSPTEGYVVDSVEDPYGQTTTAQVVTATPSQLLGRSAPV